MKLLGLRITFVWDDEDWIQEHQATVDSKYGYQQWGASTEALGKVVELLAEIEWALRRYQEREE